MQIRLFNQDFVLRWWLVIITLAAFGLLIKLSLWQWQRAEEKLQHLTQLNRWQQQGAPEFHQLSRFTDAELDGAPLTGAANWIAPFIWLVDNQIWQGQAGYDVVVPMHIQAQSGNMTDQADKVLLVNLGWVAAPATRAELPEVNVPAQLQLQGLLRTQLGAFRLGQNLEDHGRWPMRVQTIDIASFASTFPQPLFNGVFYQQQSPFLYHYQPVVLPPEKHRAYALQWLLLAIAVVMVAMAASYQKEV